MCLCPLPFALCFRLKVIRLFPVAHNEPCLLSCSLLSSFSQNSDRADSLALPEFDYPIFFKMSLLRRRFVGNQLSRGLRTGLIGNIRKSLRAKVISFSQHLDKSTAQRVFILDLRLFYSNKGFYSPRRQLPMFLHKVESTQQAHS